MRVWDRIRPKSFEPIRSIEWVIALFTLAGQIYIFSPAYEASVAANGLTPFAAALATPALIFVIAGILLIASVFLIAGLVMRRPQWRSFGLFTIMLLRFYNVLVTILTVGLLPISWIFPLTVSAICLICWIWCRVEIRLGRT